MQIILLLVLFYYSIDIYFFVWALGEINDVIGHVEESCSIYDFGTQTILLECPS